MSAEIEEVEQDEDELTRDEEEHRTHQRLRYHKATCSYCEEKAYLDEERNREERDFDLAEGR